MSATNGINWNIYHQPHGRHVTCQRPIILSTKVTLGQPACFRGVLFINSPQNSGTWVNTEVEFNAYSNAGNNIYECNVAEYCRQYFGDPSSWYNASWCSMHDAMFNKRFKVVFHPVVIQTDGTLDIDYDDGIETEQFNVVPLNTQVWENNSMDSGKADYHRIDTYVQQRDNNSGLATHPGEMSVPMTNMTQRNAVNFDKGDAWYHYPGIVDLAWNRNLAVTITNITTGASHVVQISGIPQAFYQFPVHPNLAEFMIAFSAGSMQYILIDASGNPLCEEYSIKFDYTNNAGVIVRAGPPAQRYTIVRDEQCGGKNVTTFVFRNMRGAVDWFCAKGAEKKSVSVSGSTFNRHTSYNRASGQAFGTRVGQHSKTNLWNDREDNFSVFSQPLTDEQSIWLEELIVSPEVWIVKKVDNSSENLASYATGNCLVAVTIDKGSYSIYSTEDNVNYIEFKYKLSEHTLTQKN